MTISTYCHFDHGVKTYDIDKLPNKTACELVAQECIFDARMERLKSIAKGIMATGITIALLSTAIAVAKVSAILIALAFLPLETFPPLFILVVTLGAVGSGIAFGYYSIKSTGQVILNQALDNWNNAQHYDAQASAVTLHKATLQA